MVGRRLSEAEVESYDVCPAELTRQVRVVKIPFIPGGYSGMTLGKAVLLATDVSPDGDSALLAHELVHVRQWNEQGVLGFSWQYVSSFARNLYTERGWNAAYQQIDAELEAKNETTLWRRRKSRSVFEDAEAERRGSEQDGL